MEQEKISNENTWQQDANVGNQSDNSLSNNDECKSCSKENDQNNENKLDDSNDDKEKEDEYWREMRKIGKTYIIWD